MGATTDRSRWRRLRQAVAVACLVGAVVGLLTDLGLALGLGAELRSRFTDEAHGHVVASPHIVVLGFGEDYYEAVRAGEYRPDSMLRGAVRSAASTIVGGGDVLRLHSGYVRTQYDLASLEQGAAQMIAAEAPGRWLFTLGDVRLDPPADGQLLPRLERWSETTTMAEETGGPAGLESTVLDQGTVLRTVPVAAVTLDDPPTVAPSSALLAVERQLGLDSTMSETDGGVRVDDRDIPLEDDGRLRVTYADELLPGGAQVLSAHEFVQSWMSAGFGHTSWGARQPPFEDQIVFFGLTDPNLAEMVQTPVGAQPAVIVEANAANTLLTAQYLRPIPHWQLALAAGLLAFVVALATLTLPVWLTALAPILGGWAWWASTWLLVERGHLGDLLVGVGAAVAGFVAALAWRAARELHRRRQVSGLFSRYVPEKVAHQLLDTGLVDSVLAGERLEVTVLFCDLRAFTPLAARLDPHQVRTLLDRYYEYTSQLILDHGGTLMQYVGDEVFAVWGAPLADPDRSQHALDCALAMQTERHRLDDHLQAEGLDPVRFGIGLNTGEVVAAHTGSSTRRQYSVLGDTVNVGARLCGVAEPDEIVLDDRTHQHLADPPDELRSTGPLELRGVRPGYRAWRYLPAPVAPAS